MLVTSEPRLTAGVIEREFTLGGIPGILWTPELCSAPTPLLLLGHPGGLAQMRPRLDVRARRAVDDGIAAATIETPGGAQRRPLPGSDQARADLRRALAAGLPVTADIVDRLVLPLVEESVPEWRRVIDAMQSLPEIGESVAVSGGNISVGVRLAAVEPRIVAAGLFAGSFIPRAILEEARRIAIPVHMLLQWDDEWNDRAAALELFDAFRSGEKTLNANLGGHTGVPPHAADDAARFFRRHLAGGRDRT